MPSPELLTPEVVKVVPGVVGSMISVFMLMDHPWPRRFGMFLAGAAFARFGATTVQKWTSLDIGFAGFLLGLFGMAIVVKLMETWQKFDLGSILNDWIRAVLRIKTTPKEGA